MKTIEFIKDQLKVKLRKYNISFASIRVYENAIIVKSSNEDEKEIASLEKTCKLIVKGICNGGVEIPELIAEFYEKSIERKDIEEHLTDRHVIRRHRDDNFEVADRFVQ